MKLMVTLTESDGSPVLLPSHFYSLCLERFVLPLTPIPPPLILLFDKYFELPVRIFIRSLNEFMHLEGLVGN